MKKIIIVLALVALSGCTHYVKHGASEAQVQRDKDDCEYEAMLHGGVLNDSYTTAMDIGYRRATIEINCMRKKGYTLVRGN